MGTILLLLFIAFIIAPLVCLGIAYYNGKNCSGCNAKISFELFKKMYERFPNKWYLYDEYVEFYYETDSSSHFISSTKSFRGYFGPIDLLKYSLYKRDDDIRKRKEREEKDYSDVIREFEKLETIITKK